ncbi:MAG: hypothetical protein V4685_19165 [Bacteroidota bacterium]
MTLFDLNKILIGVFLLLFVKFSFSQKATRHYVDSLLSISDSTFKESSEVFYVINGIPYDSIQVDTAIAQYDTKYLADALFLSKEKQSYPFYRDVAVILFAYKQKNKIKRRHWKSAKKLLIDAEEDNTILLIDKISIEPSQSKEKFKSVQLKDIMYIDINEKDKIKQVRIWKL